MDKISKLSVLFAKKDENKLEVKIHPTQPDIDIENQLPIKKLKFPTTPSDLENSNTNDIDILAN